MPRKLTLPRGTLVPNHIAVILDGNGRWARSRGLPVTKGHEAGARALHSVIRASRDLGVHTLTLWGFSTENWKRPSKEKSRIFDIIYQNLKHELKTAHEEKVRLVHIGRKDRLPVLLLRMIEKCERETAQYTKHLLNLALDYGGRDEIVRAVKKVLEDNVPIDKIDEDLFGSYLDTGKEPYPYPDLFIRTSGEQRTSGYLPWQMTYTEFYFEEDHLPDMTPEHLRRAILDYSCRRRRYGGKDKISHFTFKPEVTARLELAWWRLSKIPEGQIFLQYTGEHIREQWGVSKKLAGEAAELMVEATRQRENAKWNKARRKLQEFYVLIRDEAKLAFEPSVVASLNMKLWQSSDGESEHAEIETATRDYLAELYRISKLQATKAAHLRALATIEWRRAEAGGGEVHWERAEDYLEKYYKALKERVA